MFHSCCLRETKYAWWHRWSHEGNTKIIRYNKMPSRCPYEGLDGHTNTTRKGTFVLCSGKSLACQRFGHGTRSCRRSHRSCTGGHTMAWDAHTNGGMITRCEPKLDIFTFVCPSAVNFGTVWRQHNSACHLLTTLLQSLTANLKPSLGLAVRVFCVANLWGALQSLAKIYPCFLGCT